jgi:uncharacterized protein
MPRRNLSLLVLVTLVLTTHFAAQSKPDAVEYDVKEHYTKYEYRIPMRDGLHLFTSVYVPKDSSRATAVRLKIEQNQLVSVHE